MTAIKSVAGHVLATGEATPEESARLAAAVLGDDSMTPSKAKTPDELRALLRKIEGVEGQSERAAVIRRQLSE